MSRQHWIGVKSSRVIAPGVVEVITLPRVRTIAPKEVIARVEACAVLREHDPSLEFSGPDLEVQIAGQAQDASTLTFRVTLPGVAR